MSLFTWKEVHGGKTPPPGESVGPHERMSWPRTIGIGAQHVVAMFGATFVFPVVMGLDPNLAILFSGISTIIFLLVVKNAVPSYLGTSAAFVAGVGAIRAQGGDSAEVTGAIMIAGLVLLVVGILVHFVGVKPLRAALPPAVTGGVVMLIGFNLAPVVAGVYWPEDQWVGLAVATFMVIGAVLFPGFWGRISVFLGLIFGFGLSWLLDKSIGGVTRVTEEGASEVVNRVDFTGLADAAWFGLPSGTLADGIPAVHPPSVSLTFVLLVIPGVIALIAENVGHVRAVAEMTGDDLDPYMGRALGADG
ncbi:MAG TPA: solute carrier family 23 protein, partial [Beutenbergiaceae bacterium]|nr:solute carrier family 23 protein [Beutenbergiaceae bacterium]